MDRYQYLLLMAACAVGTLPLEWAFRARVYRRPRQLLRALWLPFVVFVAWDAGNRLTQLVDSVSGTIGRTYDGLDRLHIGVKALHRHARSPASDLRLAEDIRNR